MSRARLAKLEARRRAIHGVGLPGIVIYRYAEPGEAETPADEIPQSLLGTIWIPDNGRDLLPRGRKVIVVRRETEP